MNICVQKIEDSVENNKSVIHVFGRDENGVKYRFSEQEFLPYFYVKEEQQLYDNPDITSIKSGYFTIYGDKVKRITMKQQSHIRAYRNIINESFELDLKCTNRFRIDKNIYSGYDTDKKEGVDFNVAPRIMYFDIETVFTRDSLNVADTKCEITCISAYDSYLNKYITFVQRSDLEPKKEKRKFVGRKDKTIYDHSVNYFNDEREMLKYFIKFINVMSPDILTGWSSNSYDIPYLINRAKLLKINYSSLSPLNKVYLFQRERNFDITIKGLSCFDLLPAYAKLQQNVMKSLKLKDVSQEELGISKITEGLDTWKTDLEKHIYYNVCDVELCVELDKQCKVISFYDEMRKVVGCDINDTLSVNRMHDINLFRFSDGLVLPTKKVYDNEKIKGAHVEQPLKGVHKYVAILDLLSLYPSIILSCDMSPETIDENGDVKLGNGISFNTEKVGLIPKILKYCLETRAKVKVLMKEKEYNSDEYNVLDNQQNSYKRLANGMYGLLSHKGFRLYDNRVSGSVTWLGRRITKFTKKVIEEEGYKVIYGDTDSCMFIVNDEDYEERIKTGYSVADLLNEKYKEYLLHFGITNCKLFIKFEKLFSPMIFVDVKKTYAGKLEWLEGQQCNKRIIMGFGSKRSDNAAFSVKIQKTLIDMILDYEKRINIVNHFSDVLANIRTVDISDIGIPSTIKKPFEEYKTKGATIKGALYSNRYLDTQFDIGSKPRYIYISQAKTNKYPYTDVLCFEDGESTDKITDNFIIDYDKMSDVLIFKKIEKLLDIIKLSIDDIKLRKITKKTRQGVLG